MDKLIIKTTAFVSIIFLGTYRCSESMEGLSGTSGTRKARSTPTPTVSSEDSKTGSKSDQSNPDIEKKIETGSQSPNDTSQANQAVTNSMAVKNDTTTAADNPQSPFQACVFNASNVSNLPIQAKVYALPPNTPSIGNINLNSAMYKTTICMQSFNIPVRQFDTGFPNLPNFIEWFGLDARVKILIPAAGLYKFRLLSDDGSILLIDGTEVINHDSQHSPSSKDGSISLTAGTHDLKILYFQGPRYHIALQLFWTRPGGTEEIVPSSAFRFGGF